MQTKRSFMRAAVIGFSNDSRSITWHQWQAAYPRESRIGLSSSRARASASSPHGYQSTGFSACWRRYGLVSCASRFTGRLLAARGALVLGLLRFLEAPGGVDRRRQREALRPPLLDQEHELDG